jgi:capsular exopolysaccharide synthesis family protein
MEQNNGLQFESISLFCIGRQLWKNLWMIVACALIFSMTAFLYANFLRTPTYSATMTYAVTSRVSAYSSRNVLAATDVAEVLSEVLNDDSVKEELFASSKELDGFSGEISAEQIENSNFIVVTSSAETPKQAFLVLDTLRSSFPELSKYISGNVLQVIKAPAVSSVPSNSINVSHVCRNAAVVGALLMACIISMSVITSETIQTRDGAGNLLDAPVVAVIGHERTQKTTAKSKKKGSPNSKQKLRRSSMLISSPSVSMLYTEQINSVCSRLEYENREKGCSVFLITSVGASEGKSTISANLAVALSANGHKVALIDSDLRNPSQHTIFGHKREDVLSLDKLLALDFSDENMCACARIDVETNVLLLCSNVGADRSTELLSSPCMAFLIARLRSMGYMIVIDSPPMGLFPDSEILADLCDASLMVVRQDVVPASMLNDAVDVLSACKSKFLGCVLNDMRGYSSGSAYGRYGYGKNYKYGYGRKTESKNSATEAGE